MNGWTLILVFPMVFFLSLFFEGVDRKIHSRLQQRVGPPILQPFYDFFKLIHKEIIIPETASRRFFTLMPIAATAVSFLIASIPIMSLIEGVPIAGDLILIMYLFAMVSVFIMIGGTASGNPFGGISFSRKMVMMLGYEVPLILAIISIAFAPSNSLTFLDVIATQKTQRSVLAFMSLGKAFAAATFLICIPAAAEVTPFDIAEAKSEIVHGYLIEYSGVYLALIKLAKASLKFALCFLAATLFFFTPALFEEQLLFGNISAFLLSLLGALIVMVCTITIPRTLSARLKIGQALKFYWGIPLFFAVAALILSILGL